MQILKIPNQIINGTLTPLALSRVDTIALHHMACNNPIKDIEKMHLSNGWAAIGYNFWVGFDGEIYQGRGFNKGAGVENHNSHVISIGFQGDYHSKERKMPDKQFDSGIDIINYVIEKIPNIKRICGHRDLMATACPGRYFPLNEMKSLRKRATKVTTPADAIAVLNKAGIINTPDIWYNGTWQDADFKALIIKFANYIKNGGK